MSIFLFSFIFRLRCSYFLVRLEDANPSAQKYTVELYLENSCLPFILEMQFNLGNRR